MQRVFEGEVRVQAHLVVGDEIFERDPNDASFTMSMLISTTKSEFEWKRRIPDRTSENELKKYGTGRGRESRGRLEMKIS